MGVVSREGTTKNLGANIIYFIINIIIGIFLVPFFISTLGIAAYGLIPLATSLIGYVGILTNSLNSAVSRHLTIDMQRSERNQANRTFNSAFFGVSKIVLILIPIVLVIAFFAPGLFGVPSTSTVDATGLFIGIGLAFLIRSWSSNFSVTLYASNRLDLVNFVNIINILVQVLLIFILFSISTPSLASIGVSYLIGATVATIATILLYRKMNKKLTIDYDCYDGQKFREMAQMSGWIIINDIGALLLLNIDLIVVNYIYGNAVGGEYAIAYQWVGLLRGLAFTFVAILGPIILISYANGQKDKIIAFSKSAVKLVGLGIALPIGIICGLAPSILGAWVGAEFVGLAPLMIILTSHLVINTAVTPLFQVNIAHNKVKWPAIVTIIMGIVDLILAFIFSLSLGLGIYGVALAGLLCMTLKNFIFTPIYATIVLGIPKWTFYPAIFPGILAMACIALISVLWSIIIDTAGIGTLAFLCLITTGLYALIFWRFLLKDSEKIILPLWLRQQ